MESYSPDISLILPYRREDRWSDLLATLINNDPQPLLQLVGLEGVGARAKREVSVSTSGSTSDRVDIVVSSGDPESEQELVVIECKVLSSLGDHQLERYSATYPAERHLLVTMSYRTFDTPEGWKQVTWKDVLAEFIKSSNTWVSSTAASWSNYIQDEGQVCGTDLWNRLIRVGGDPYSDLQRKAAYLCDPSVSDFRFGDSTAGGKPLLVFHKMFRQNPYAAVHIEVEGSNSRSTLFTYEDRKTLNIGGLRAFVGIWEDLSSVDEPFDWRPLVDAWPLIERAQIDWERRVAGKKKSSREDQERLLELHSRELLPRFFGKGYRMKDACEYGGKTKALPADSSLDEVAEFLSVLSVLGRRIVENLGAQYA